MPSNLNEIVRSWIRLQAADSLYIYFRLKFLYVYFVAKKDFPNIFGFNLKIVKYFVIC